MKTLKNLVIASLVMGWVFWDKVNWATFVLGAALPAVTYIAYKWVKSINPEQCEEMLREKEKEEEKAMAHYDAQMQRQREEDGWYKF